MNYTNYTYKETVLINALANNYLKSVEESVEGSNDEITKQVQDKSKHYTIITRSLHDKTVSMMINDDQ